MFGGLNLCAFHLQILCIQLQRASVDEFGELIKLQVLEDSCLEVSLAILR